MRIGILSDIHSNIIAFKECTKCLEELGCDEYLFLGDYISDTPYARQTMDYLYEFIGSHKCTLLRGNREEYMLSQREELGQGRRGWINNSASGNLLYTYEQLTDRDLDFFESLPISFIYEREGYPAITCCHGSPDNTRELLQFDGSNTEGWLGKITTDYMLCAHTHFPGEHKFGDKYYFNTGCIGISIGTPGYAQCMIIDSIHEGKTVWKPEFLLVPYDNKRVVYDCFKMGLSDRAPWFINSNIQILLTGEDNAAKMVNLAKQLQAEAGDNRQWPEIEEEYFEAAARQLGIPDYRQ